MFFSHQDKKTHVHLLSLRLNFSLCEILRHEVVLHGRVHLNDVAPSPAHVVVHNPPIGRNIGRALHDLAQKCCCKASSHRRQLLGGSWVATSRVRSTWFLGSEV